MKPADLDLHHFQKKVKHFENVMPRVCILGQIWKAFPSCDK